MKKFIYKTNQYLLENHPIIWNSKIVWVLLSTTILHVLFFLFGFITLITPETLHERGAETIFFNNGTVFINIMLSILILVIWLFHLFKNNTFKSFYPTSKLKLFKQFSLYLIIVFVSSTFYISYNYGIKSYINYSYKKDTVKKDIEFTNMVAMFFSEELTDYTINNRKYPYPFNSLYRETFEGLKIASDTTLLSFLDFSYRFYSVYKKEGAINQAHIDSTYKNFVYYKIRDPICTYFFKDSIVDISKFETSAKPTYFNYSKTFYTPKAERTENTYPDYYDYYRYNDTHTPDKKSELQNKKGHELLKRNDQKEIKKILTAFLSLAHKYKIRHNLTVDQWFKLIYHPKSFQLKSLIRSEPKINLQFAIEELKTATQEFNKNHITDYFINHHNLHNAFENIENIKASSPFSQSIHFFLWFAFFFSALVFAFRITGLKPLIFSIITIGVLTIFVALITIVIDYSINYIGYFAAYLTLLIGSIILSIPLFFLKKIRKTMVAIWLNISILGFILYVFLILVVISLHQSDACTNTNHLNLTNNDCFNLLGSLELTWSYILFVVNLIFIYFYAEIIKNWKALPDG